MGSEGGLPITYIRIIRELMRLVTVIGWHTRAAPLHKLSNIIDATLVAEVLEDAPSNYPAQKYLTLTRALSFT